MLANVAQAHVGLARVLANIEQAHVGLVTPELSAPLAGSHRQRADSAAPPYGRPNARQRSWTKMAPNTRQRSWTKMAPNTRQRCWQRFRRSPYGRPNTRQRCWTTKEQQKRSAQRFGGHRIMAITLAFQARDAGSIPAARSKSPLFDGCGRTLVNLKICLKLLQRLSQFLPYYCR